MEAEGGGEGARKVGDREDVQVRGWVGARLEPKMSLGARAG